MRPAEQIAFSVIVAVVFGAGFYLFQVALAATANLTAAALSHVHSRLSRRNR